MNNKQAGKGDKPRSCFSATFKANFDTIKWGSKKIEPTATEVKKSKKTYKY